jgi:hypothetical protein
LLAALLKATRKPPRWLVVLFLALAAILAVPMAAQAQAKGNMLFLSVTETVAGSITQQNSAWATFSAQATAMGLTPLDRRGALSSATTPLSVPANTKLVVVAVHTAVPNAARLNELTTLMSTRPDLAFILFIDGCCSNLTPYITAINSTIKPATWPTLTLGAVDNSLFPAPLNTASLYAPTFAAAGLTTMTVNAYTPIFNVPLDYALYTKTALPNPPPTIVTQPIAGFFMPQTASNGGKGACLFLTADLSVFLPGSGYDSQFPNVAKAFISAATDPNGACKQPASGAPDLWAKLSETTPLTLANPTASMTLTVGNLNQPGVTASTNGQVDVTLPTGLTLVSPPAGCTATAGGFTCALPPLAPKDPPVTFDFEVTAPSPIPGTAPVTVTATVSGVTGEINLGNNSFTLDDIFTADGSPFLTTTLTGDTNLYTDAPYPMTLTVSNSDAPGVTASTDGTVDVTLPADVQLVGPPPAGCIATATGLTCNVGPLAPGEHVDFTFEVIAPNPILTDTSISAEVAVPGNAAPDNGATILPDISTIDSPDLLIALAGPSNLPIDSATTMSVTVSNSGEPGVGPLPSGGTVTVTLPDGVELVSPPAGCTATANGFTCPVGALDPGESAPALEFQVIASDPMTGTIDVEVAWPTSSSSVLARNKLLRDISAGLATVTPVPTLTELALALLALTVVGSSAAGLRRKR